MGYFWEGIPPYLLPIIAKALGPDVVAVETGTYQGDSTLKFAEVFGACTTIERSETLGKAAQERFTNDSRINVLIGSSRDLLATALPERERACFIWLDAHGVYDHSGADTEENPLLAEVEVIANMRGSRNTVIGIDDARGMGTQPGWPSTGQISKLLLSQGFDVILLDDILLAFDPKSTLDTYAIYKASRQTEISMLFHIWPKIKRVIERQRTVDALVSRVRR